jgi:CheY-like chemotaxis protein
VQPKLLLADDSVTIQRVIELTFADEDVKVVAVGDGKQAIERVQSDRPDIVLADVGMPEKDGYEVAAFIKGNPELAHIPVLLLTGAFEPVDEARARAVGCDGVLVKPFEPQMVISRVRDLLAGKRESAPGKAAVPAAPAAAEPPGGLEAYFDRLDAALASKTAAGAAHAQNVHSTERVEHARAAGSARGTSEIDLSGWNPPAVAESGRAATAEAADGGSPVAVTKPAAESVAAIPAVSLDEAFSALLAAEQGIAATPPSASPSSRAPSAALPETLPDAVIDAVAERVIARMGDDKMRAAVLDAAERLVREEIDRIKNAR